MSYTRVSLAAQARILAKDQASASDNTTVYGLLTDIYARYDHAFLRERIRLINATFVTIPAGAYIATSAVTALDVISIERSAGAGTIAQQQNPIERDDFYAVVADAEGAATFASTEVLPSRWGAMKLQDGSSAGLWRVAVFPAMTGSTNLAAWGHVAVTALSADGTVADLEDIDALNITRLLAAEIMWNNGDPADAIAAVLGPLDTTIKAKFAYLAQRSPRRLPDAKSL